MEDEIAGYLNEIDSSLDEVHSILLHKSSTGESGDGPVIPPEEGSVELDKDKPVIPLDRGSVPLDKDKPAIPLERGSSAELDKAVLKDFVKSKCVEPKENQKVLRIPTNTVQNC